MKRSLVTISCALCVSHTMQAAFAQEFTPATFGQDARSISKTLRVPDERPSGRYDVSLRCQVIVEPDGAVTHPHCLTEERFGVFQREALRALSGSVMTPATVETQAVRVALNFLIGYRCDESCEIVLLPHHAGNVDSFGMGYVAPQPILEDDTWYQGYEKKLDWADSGLTAEEVGGIQFIVSTRVNESGRASRTDVDMDSNGFTGGHYEDTAKLAARSLRDVSYIPGFYEGVPQTMRLYEYWLDPDASPPTVLTIPVRLLLLTSESVPELDTTLTESQVRRLFVETNEVWKQAGIEWTVESVLHAGIANEQRYLRDTERARERGWANAPISDTIDAMDNACPEELLLEDGWNVCFLRRLPGGLSGGIYSRRIGAVIFGGRSPQSWSRGLAHELGHSLGLLHTAPCTRALMRDDNGTPRCEIEGSTATRLDGEQIAVARAQALKQEPWSGP